MTIPTIPVLSYREHGRAPHVDLPALISSKMLIQAASGGGKSWAVRQLCEETFGRVPHIILDPEGEFYTLRERHDYVLAALRGGDVEASPKTAPVLARRLVELGASAVIDLYEMKADQKRAFVRIFLEHLMALPRDLWRPTLVIIDEVHLFAPEKGFGEAESLAAVEDLSSRGRKRGFCLVAATQRISKFHKDVIGNLHNKMIGLATLDVDMDRAAKDLGFDREARRSLATLEPGQFYVYGPAISKTVDLVRTGDVRTTHPKPGTTVATATVPASSRVKSLIASSLADLPQAAEEEARTLDTLRMEVRTLRGDLARAQRSAVVPHASAAVSVSTGAVRETEKALRVAERGYLRTIATLRKSLEAAMKFVVNVSAQNFDVAGVDRTEIERAMAAAIDKATSIIDQRLTGRAKQMDALRMDAQRILKQLESALSGDDVIVNVDVTKNEAFTIAPTHAPRTPVARVVTSDTTPRADGVSGVEQKILNTLKALEDVGITPVDKPTAAALVGYHPNAKSYPTGGQVALTDDGRAIAHSQLSITSLEELHATWYDRLGNVAQRILAPLITAFPKTLDRGDVAENAGYHPNAKSFANMIGRLRTLGLIDYPSTGKVVATKILFPEGLY